MANVDRKGFVPPEADDKGKKEAREQQRTSVDVPISEDDGTHVLVSNEFERPGVVGFSQFGDVTVSIRNTKVVDQGIEYDQNEYLAIQLPDWIKKVVTEDMLSEVLRSLRPDLQGKSIPDGGTRTMSDERLFYLLDEIRKAKEQKSS